MWREVAGGARHAVLIRPAVHDRLGHEVAQAVAVSKAVGKPVKLIWTREEELCQGRYRTQAAIRFKAALAADGSAECAQYAQFGGKLEPGQRA